MIPKAWYFHYLFRLVFKVVCCGIDIALLRGYK
nr:DUF3265 domain-containing protein [Vibrio owensii]